MSATAITELCRRARPELACLGDLGLPLRAVLSVVERIGAEWENDALADPGFALDVLTAASGTADAATVGRVLDFLRLRAGAAPTAESAVRSGVTLAAAVELYERARWR